MRFPSTTTIVCVLAAAVAAAAKKKHCYDTLDGKPFETVCYRVLANTSSGLAIREFEGANAAAFVVSYEAPSSITTYQEALMLTSFYVIEYFVNKSLSGARTVPLTLRNPSPAHEEWVAGMALAPSLWPPASTPPTPTHPTKVAPFGTITLASLRAVVQESPQPSDFDALCAALRTALQSELPAYKVDEASPITSTHARYNTELWSGPWQVECWLGVVKA